MIAKLLYCQQRSIIARFGTSKSFDMVLCAHYGCTKKSSLINVGCMRKRRSLCRRASISTHSEPNVVPPKAVVEAKDVVQQMYDAYNAKDIGKISDLMAEGCEYHDLAVYQDPFVGKHRVVEYFSKVMEVFPDGVKFVVDDITSNDPSKCGVMWHMEIEGVFFPFTRGCSFYTVNSNGKITQARDLVEPPFKSGAGALQGLKLIAPIIKLVKPTQSGSLSIESALMWLFYVLYSGVVLLSTLPPGQPGYSTPPESFQTIFDVSINFYYVNIALAQYGLTPFPSPVSHPVYEGIFNFVCAWGMMFLPVILTDKKCQKIPNKVPWWLGIMFITNVVFIPFLALRAAPEPQTQRPTAVTDVSWSSVLGWSGIGIGLFSFGWLLYARPEFGDFAARWDYFMHMFSSDRVFWAFMLDTVLYSVWQAQLLKGTGGKFRFLPFFGLGAWLISGCPRIIDGQASKRTSAKA